MDKLNAVTAFRALGHDTRIEVFRLLIAEAPKGLPAGEIADRVGVVQNTMSSHLATLTQAGLIRAERRGRTILYGLNPDQLTALLSYLMEDCCGTRPECCLPVLKRKSEEGHSDGVIA
ncbi:ArsR/SmtB family transcription factor [Coralliovum pocilloporae]|uniref:ArsR/SmtB family transcription factor n=1 Tax=Coralliovum pocilloporae TaxID=3066369 RepID=UPI003306C0A0